MSFLAVCTHSRPIPVFQPPVVLAKAFEQAPTEVFPGQKLPRSRAAAGRGKGRGRGRGKSGGKKGRGSRGRAGPGMEAAAPADLLALEDGVVDEPAPALEDGVSSESASASDASDGSQESFIVWGMGGILVIYNKSDRYTGMIWKAYESLLYPI